MEYFVEHEVNKKILRFTGLTVEELEEEIKLLFKINATCSIQIQVFNDKWIDFLDIGTEVPEQEARLKVIATLKGQSIVID